MKKYKLIKEYPGSPKLGTKVFKSGEYWCKPDKERDSDAIVFSNDECNPSKYSEFWKEIIEYPIGTRVHNSQTNIIYTKKEDGWYKPASKTAYTDDMITKTNCITIVKDKVIEKDYEILSFKQNSSMEDLWESVDTICDKFARKSGQMFCTKPYTLEQILNNPLYSIYSVKRLSDGEVFTIGDILEVRGKKDAPLKWINNCYDSIQIGTGYSMVVGLNEIQHSKKPLFTTEDGVDIFEGDKLFSVNSCFRINKHKINNVEYDELCNENCHQITNNPCKEYTYFSNKEAAEEYILMNKPSLSLKEVLDNFSSSRDSTKERLTKIVKSKL